MEWWRYLDIAQENNDRCTANYALRDLEGKVTGFEVDTVRQMIADYLQPPAQ